MLRKKADVIRLRKESEIVGYRKRVHNTVFFSRDFYAWSGEEILFDQSDAFSGFHDKDNKPLFAGDIIRIATWPHKHFILEFDELIKAFLLVDFETNTTFDRPAVEAMSEAISITRVSTVFIN